MVWRKVRENDIVTRFKSWEGAVPIHSTCMLPRTITRQIGGNLRTRRRANLCLLLLELVALHRDFLHIAFEFG